MTERRIVVTGMGAVTPLGIDIASTWKAACGGQSGIGPTTQPLLPGIREMVAGEVKDFDPQVYMPTKVAGRLDRFQQLAIVAASEAIRDAGLTVTDENRHRMGVVVCASSGGYQTFERELLHIRERGGRSCSPFAITKIMPNGASAAISMKFGMCGPSSSLSTACASSADGLGYALLLLRSGICDVVVAGGTEASIHSVSVAAFDRMGLLSRRARQTPSPFCRSRDGFVLAEGSAVLVLETLAHARRRGAAIRAELAGYGATSDAHHITTPTANGQGAARAITAALTDACLTPADIGYVNAHGTGTPINDLTETAAIHLALRDSARHVPVSSTKSMTGHLIGAAGALETIFCVLTLQDGVLPPTINFEEADPMCNLDCVPNVARQSRVDAALTNSFGFGGHNAALVLKSARLIR